MTGTHWSYSGQSDRKPLQYTDCGLDDVYLVSGYEWVDTPEGKALVIKELDKLLRAIGVHLVTEKKVLNAKEVRFLRKELNMTQAELARYAGLTHQQVARWEKGESEITDSAAAILRLLYLDHYSGKRFRIRKLLDKIIETDATTDQRRAVFQKTEDGWEPAVAA
jgi:DNA-binding transcriptional regulator YiaG